MTRFQAMTALILSAAALTGCQSLSRTESPAGEKTTSNKGQSSLEKPVALPEQKTPEQEVTLKPLPTPEITVTQTFIQTPAHIDGKLVVGFAEEGVLPDLGLSMSAKIDTGASRTSIDARNVESFERDGKPWVRFELHRTSKGVQNLELPVQEFIAIKRPGEKSHRRPVVTLTVQIGKITQSLNVSLNDRDNFNYPLLVGRDFLQDLAIADVGKIDIAITRPLKTIQKTIPETKAELVDRTIYQTVSVNGLSMFGALEFVHLNGISEPLKARIDTGAETSSLDARDLEFFEKDSQQWVRFKLLASDESIQFELPVSRSVLIKRHGDLESQRRPVVKLQTKVGNITKTTEFTLRDRSSYEYPVLLAEQFLADVALVDVSQEYIADKPAGGNR